MPTQTIGSSPWPPGFSVSRQLGGFSLARVVSIRLIVMSTCLSPSTVVRTLRAAAMRCFATR